MDITGIFKLRIVDFVKEGIDKWKVFDQLFYMDPGTNGYISLN